MNPYEQYISTLASLQREAREYPLGAFPPYPRPAPSPDAPVALIFSPHPDDEVIVGGWALRLLREKRWRVVNVAVTHGSNVQRQPERWAELSACCGCIGFDLVTTAPRGLEGINPKARASDPDGWTTKVETVRALLDTWQPAAIFYPHESDWNSTHVGTHWLVKDALASLPAAFTCAAIETEYWAQMPAPNVLVECPAQDLASLVTALTFHVGEVRRNPYHLTLPAWMMDNVRRGGEWVGGQGQAAPAFLFGTLYRVGRWRNRRFEPVAVPAPFLSAADDPSAPLA
ncbi:MAG: PIG-L family deacetylase [Acidobacteria bacterium]|nr:PIG-L family deacetylase [Acidobacteriota bacterium]